MSEVKENKWNIHRTVAVEYPLPNLFHESENPATS